MSIYKINVKESEYESEVIARVTYNSNLDYWDGKNWTNGGTGYHKGITKLKDGRYVLIIGSNWQGQKDYAYIVEMETALQEILKSNHLELLDLKKFSELKELYENSMIEEDLESEEE